MFNQQRIRGLLRGLQTVRKDACGCTSWRSRARKPSKRCPPPGKPSASIGELATWRSAANESPATPATSSASNGRFLANRREATGGRGARWREFTPESPTWAWANFAAKSRTRLRGTIGNRGSPTAGRRPARPARRAGVSATKCRCGFASGHTPMAAHGTTAT